MKALTLFNVVDAGKVDIIVSELVSNLVKHVGDGEVLYRFSTPGEPADFEIICIDKGPGIKDPVRAMKDGMSTTRTLGQGLGALERLSTTFHMLSIPRWGTVAYARFGPKAKTSRPRTGLELDIKTLLVPKPMEDECGDGYQVVDSKSMTKVMFGDGLGHGKHAREAMDSARNFFFECPETDPVDIIRQMHEHVRTTRGLGAVVAILDKKTSLWSLCGAGNIAARLYSGIEYRNYMSYNGTIGLNIPKSMNATVIPADRHQHLIMCSDGISTRWDISRYPSVFKFDQLVLAGALYKDFSRGNDDASVLVAKVV